jgi:uncharacterized GH25 family protein
MHRQFRAFLLALCFAAVSSQAAITGVVMTTDGAPVSGARVSIKAVETLEASRARVLSGTAEVVPIASTQTDLKGTFSLESPKDTTVDLTVYARGYEPQQKRIERDEEVGAIALAKAEMKKGSVTAGGKAVAGANVILFYGAYEYSARTDEQGRYEAPDPKRVRSIVVIHPDYALHEEQFLTPNSTPASALQRTIVAGSAMSGRVLAAQGDAPVANATVIVDSWPLATTAEDGTFSIAHMPPKWKNAIARKDSLIGQRASTSKEPGLTIRVAKGATVSGRVTDVKTRVPVVGAMVRIGTRRFMASDVGTTTYTDAKGAYSLVVPAGTYMVWATHPAYDPKSVDAGATPGQSTSKDLAVSPLARVSGVVSDESKRPVAAAVIVTETTDTMRMGMRIFRGSDSTVSGPDGRFSMRLQPDEELWLKATKRGLPPAKSDAIKLAAAERKTGVALVIPTGIAVSGLVTDANGDPLSGVAVTTSESETGPRGMMMRSFIGGGSQGDDDAVLSASDGTFTVRVKEGTYDFAFRREGYAPKSVRGQTVSAISTPTVEARLEPAVEITGRVVRNGAGVENVRIFSFGPGGGGEVNVVTGPDGSFTIGGLAAGALRIMARKDEDFINEMRNVTAPSRDLVIELPAGGRVSGRVVDKQTGKPVTAFQAGISISRAGGGMVMMAPPLMRDFTSDDGSFVLEGVPTGAVVLAANAPGYSSGRLNLNVEEGKPLGDIELQLDTGIKLTGRVTAPNGTALSDVTVRVMPSPTGGFATSGMERMAITDSNGEYTIDALEAGDETVLFSHAKYSEQRKTVALKGRETKLDVQLASGLRITGTVVTDSGAPVPDADVEAYSSSGFESARTNASGAFEFETTTPGRYRFTATKTGYAQGILEDVDVGSGTPVRITLGSGGTIYGRVIGLTPKELGDATVEAYAGRAMAQGTIDANGNFRIEGVPAGTVQVNASSGMGLTGSARRSSPVTVELAPGGSQQVDITFRGDIVISGRVLRNGVPIPGATIYFNPRATTSRASAMSPTDSEGRYTVQGLEEGEYNVTVGDRNAPYSTTYQVRGTATYDIDYRTASMRGRVLDVATNEPIANVAVQLRNTLPQEGFRSGRGAVTDAAGAFILDSVAPGNYTLTATKEGFASDPRDVFVGESAPADVELRMARNEGVTLVVLDARDNRPVAARASVFDMQGRLVLEPRMMFGGAEPGDLKLAVGPGTYTATVTATGYAPRNIRFQSPSKDTVRLSPGGTLIVRSKHNNPVRIRFIDANGLPYPRFSNFPSYRELAPSPGTTPMPNMAAGTYTMQLLGENDAVLQSKQVVVVEGQTVTEEI